MSIELSYLVWTVLLALGQMLVAGIGANLQAGLAATGGNRERALELTGWAGRARRAHANMLENLPLFAALVLTAQLAGRSNAMTAMGAAIFFWARVAHGAIYVAGLGPLRSLAFLVSVIGLVMILLQLV
ncbi:MAG: MAPEG family protein [Rhodospirillales bacterium]|nr:MAPEG family protein [Rhodospirillales bacterium]MDE2199094.1 MAPEG family protein [Rhodospirillales bacterium]MDE2575601.1 MAPEG family protein [Rhodospirillales bacterium]